MRKFCINNIIFTSTSQMGDYSFETELPEEQVLIYLEEIFNSLYVREGIRWMFLRTLTVNSDEFQSWYEVNVATKELDVSRAYMRFNGIGYTALGIPDTDTALLMEMAWT